jgi:hypothetical protein
MKARLSNLVKYENAGIGDNDVKVEKGKVVPGA